MPTVAPDVTGFFHQPTGILEGLLRADLETHEGHIGHEQAAAHAPGHQTGVIDHLLHGDGQGVLLPLNHHAERIAHENGVHSRLVDEMGEGVIVGGQERQLHAPARNAHSLGHFKRWRTQRIDGVAIVCGLAHIA